MRYVQMLNAMNSEELEEFKNALMSNPNLLDDQIQKIKEKENESKKLEEEKIEKEKQKIENLKKTALIEKENAERFVVNPVHFANQIIEYYKQMSALSRDTSLDLEARIKARLCEIVSEITLIYTVDYYDELKDNNQNNFSWKYLNSLESQYEILSYEYGKLIGLPDEEIINKTEPFFYSIDSAMVKSWETGMTVDNFFNSFYDIEEQPYHKHKERNENGIITYTNNYNNISYAQDKYREISDEYKSWRDDYLEDEKIMPACEVVATFINELYSKKNNSSVENEELIVYGPEDYKKINRPPVKATLRDIEEKELFETLMTLAESKIGKKQSL